LERREQGETHDSAEQAHEESQQLNEEPDLMVVILGEFILGVGEYKGIQVNQHGVVLKAKGLFLVSFGQGAVQLA